MIRKILILCIFILLNLYSKENLYTHIPSDLPSNKSQTSFGTKLIELIHNSNNEIRFAIYGLRGQDDILQALLNAKKRGVNIKGVVDSDTKGRNYYTDTHLLYKHFDIVSDNKSYIMHNKFFVIDKKNVWSGSSNISDTGTGGYNANNSMTIENKKIASIYLHEFYEMFSGKFGIHKSIKTTKNIKTDDSIISLYFSPKSRTYQNGIKELILNAKEYIYIPIFYLTHKPLSKQLIQAHKRGVDIRVILDASAARNKYSTHKILRKNGIKVKVENFGGKMHAKSIIIDDKYFVSGSMNLTKAGNSKNDENTIIVKNRLLTKQYKQYFLKLWNMIPNKYLHNDPNPESLESGYSCFDGINNDFDHTIDSMDNICNNELAIFKLSNRPQIVFEKKSGII